MSLATESVAVAGECGCIITLLNKVRKLNGPIFLAVRIVDIGSRKSPVKQATISDSLHPYSCGFSYCNVCCLPLRLR